MRQTASYRWAIASRSLLAIVGGYVLAALTGGALALALARSPSAIAAGNLAATLIYPATAFWCFGAKTALRAALGILLPICALAWVWIANGILL